ncbi:hypothetical protein [Nocardia sp. NPDC059239]|uniref:hypothetical protein n=1 Tax=Nocardia sp. NPDC059239 TaxID=3346785 RepID=UPI00367DEAFE
MAMVAERENTRTGQAAVPVAGGTNSGCAPTVTACSVRVISAWVRVEIWCQDSPSVASSRMTASRRLVSASGQPVNGRPVMIVSGARAGSTVVARGRD